MVHHHVLRDSSRCVKRLFRARRHSGVPRCLSAVSSHCSNMLSFRRRDEVSCTRRDVTAQEPDRKTFSLTVSWRFGEAGTLRHVAASVGALNSLRQRLISHTPCGATTPADNAAATGSLRIFTQQRFDGPTFESSIVTCLAPADTWMSGDKPTTESRFLKSTRSTETVHPLRIMRPPFTASLMRQSLIVQVLPLIFTPTLLPVMEEWLMWSSPPPSVYTPYIPMHLPAPALIDVFVRLSLPASWIMCPFTSHFRSTTEPCSTAKTVSPVSVRSDSSTDAGARTRNMQYDAAQPADSSPYDPSASFTP
eukprot:Rhum_TRINITY_DN14241_c2_g1::Rhum_TRINITY_DN14241_c2_g1_i1::g.74526::m.74526